MLALQKPIITEKTAMDIPNEVVEKADGSVIEQMKQRGITVLPLAQNNNWLSVNFVIDKKVNAEVLQWLPALKKQLIWLKMGDTDISDSSMRVIGQLGNLRWLSLENTNITDKGIEAIQSLQNLRYLNLVGTKVTTKGIMQLKDLKFLHSLYLYRTSISKSDWPELQKAFPKTRIDSGGYLVPLLPTDTVIVKVKKEY